MEIKDHYFLVSGAASGLGAACAQRLAQKGAKLILVDKNQRGLEQLRQQHCPNALALNCDITDEDEVKKMFERIKTLHGLINCAGISLGERMLSREGKRHQLQSFQKIIQVNLIGTFLLTSYSVEKMFKNKDENERGVLINTASVAAYDGQKGQVAYSASKGAIAAMTLPLARDLASFHIRAMTLAPGIFDTPMVQQLPLHARESLAQQIPFPPRLGDPQEFSSLVEHIIENQMLNGEVIRLDGALRMGPH